MTWHARFQSNPQYAHVVRLATGRPVWVLRATGMVAVVVLCVPLIALAVLMVAAVAIIATAWVVFSAIARVIDAITGAGKPTTDPSEPPAAPGDDGRDNVRVIHRS